MKTPTMRQINQALQNAFPDVEIEFVKGKGYFYFVTNTVSPPESIYVYKLADLNTVGMSGVDSVLAHALDWYENEYEGAK